MAYSFQVFTLAQVLTAAQMNQVEVNIRDHQHGVDGVFEQAATQADQEAGTSILLYATPGRQHFHKSAAKGWSMADALGNTPNISYNVSSVTDGGTGSITINWNTDFSSANHCAVAGFDGADLTGDITVAAATTRLVTHNISGAPADPTFSFIVAFGDQ